MFVGVCVFRFIGETKENHLFFVCVVRDIKRVTPLAERERGKPFAHVICGGRAQSYDTVIHRPCVFYSSCWML